MGQVSHSGWVRRIRVPLLSLAIGAAVLALVFSEPRTFSNILDGFFMVLAAPFQSAWLRVRSTGPVRRTMLLVAFVALPVILLPMYAIRAKKSTWILTAVGVLLWLTSGFLMLALRADD